MLQELVTHTQQWEAKLGSLPGFSTAITLAFLQIVGMEWLAMILDSQVPALVPRFFRNST